MFHLGGFTESQDSATLVNVAALADQQLTISGDELRVPEQAPILLAAYTLGPSVTRSMLVSPSLRRIFNYEIKPIDVGAEPAANPPFISLIDNPIQLEAEEPLTAQASEDGSGATRATVLVWLGSEVPRPVDGEIFTIRATNTTTLIANTWTNGPLTFDQTLPAGTYAIVGARAESAGLQAFRVAFVGGGFRPGGLGCDAVSDLNVRGQRFGGWGEWGRFRHTTPPTVDFLSNSADTSQVVDLDLVKVG